MKKNGWKAIWEKKKIALNSPINIETLIALDGFDRKGIGHLYIKSWLKYNDFVLHTLKVENGQSLCEIGCGAGAFLFPIAAKGIKVAGVDFAENLLTICKNAIPEGQFFVAEANKLPFSTNSFDAVVCNSVFHYFPSLGYAEEVIAELGRILLKGKKGAILDINDETKQQEYIQRRSQDIGLENYQALYKNTPHTFYSKEWIIQVCNKYGLKVTIIDQHIDGYINSSFRFNAFLEKE